jgi:hypothetical protein
MRGQQSIQPGGAALAEEFERLPGISNRENDWVQMLLKTGQITPEYYRDWLAR